MKTKLLKSLFVSFLALILPACTSVGVQTSMGDPEDVFSPEQLEGGWLIHADENDKTAYDLRHLADGSIRIATLDWNPKKRAFQAVEYEGLFLRIGKEPYLQVRDTSSEDNLFYFYRVAMKGEDGVILHPPSLAPFVRAVEAGELAGTVKQSKGSATSVVLDVGLELRSYLESSEGSSLFPAGDEDVIAERLNR